MGVAPSVFSSTFDMKKGGTSQNVFSPYFYNSWIFVEIMTQYVKIFNMTSVVSRLPERLWNVHGHSFCKQRLHCLCKVMFVPEQFSWESWKHVFRMISSPRFCCSSAAQLVSYHDKARVPLNYMIVEEVFGQLFNLPHPVKLEAAYASLLLASMHVMWLPSLSG